MNETGKISEALQLAIQTINLVNTENGVPYDELEQIRAALPLAEQLEAEVVSLRAELEQAKKEIQRLSYWQVHVRDKEKESADLRAQVEQLTTDKARLDWITSSPVEVVPSSIKYFLFQHPPSFKTPREAIDAAMKESQ